MAFILKRLCKKQLKEKLWKSFRKPGELLLKKQTKTIFKKNKTEEAKYKDMIAFCTHHWSTVATSGPH